jgi:hypothetical protein
MPFSPALSLNSTIQERAHREAKYSFDWALSIIIRAQQSHPRAWEIFGPILGLSTRQLSFLLACDAPEWPYIRSLAQQLDKWIIQAEKVRPGSSSTIEGRAGIIRGLAYKCQKCPFPPLKAYLTAKFSGFTM